MGPEWIVVGVIAVAVLFGAKKIPEMARSVGRAQGEFKRGMRDGAVEDAEAAQAQSQATPAPAPQSPPTTAPPAATPPAQAPPPAATPPAQAPPPAATPPEQPPTGQPPQNGSQN